MGNIAYKEKVDTNREYQALSDILGISLNEGVTYVLQVTGSFTFYIGTSKPTKGGNELNGGTIVKFKLADGDQAYLRTWNIPSNVNLQK